MIQYMRLSRDDEIHEYKPIWQIILKELRDFSKRAKGFNTQVPSSDIITSLCGYSSVSEAWKVFVYVNGGASAIRDA